MHIPGLDMPICEVSIGYLVELSRRYCDSCLSLSQCEICGKALCAFFAKTKYLSGHYILLIVKWSALDAN